MPARMVWNWSRGQAIVICYPVPLNGANMDNKVVVPVFVALVGRGFTILRFNFRGVGNSH